MLRKLFIIMLLACAGLLQAQQLKVVEFRADLSMTDAVQFPKNDYNGDRCGLIKLGLALPVSDVTFEGDIISSENKAGEWWIYMPKGSNWLTIKSKSNTYLPLRCEFEGIQSNVTYVMNVVEVPYSSINSISALWRSAILPGWGQFYKNRNGRGTLIVIGETLTLAAGGLSLYNELNQKSIMDQSEVSYQDYMAAEKSYEQWNTARHISFITAAVIYGLNMVDAYLTPAKPQKNLTLAPNVMNANGELAVGTTLLINF